MGKVFIQDTEIQDIADAIREKNGTEELYLPSEMGNAIRAILTNIASSQFPNILLSEVTVDQSCETANQVRDYLLSIVESNNNTSFFVNKKALKNDKSIVAENELLFFVIYGIYGSCYSRVVGDVYTAGGNASSAYPLTLNVGDEGYLVEIVQE